VECVQQNVDEHEQPEDRLGDDPVSMGV
jgi:hypothetical protein